MDSPDKNWGRKLGDSFAYAFQGIWTAVKSERNLQIELFIGLCAILLAAYVQVETWEWLAILLICIIVIMGEMFNSALEAVVDLTVGSQMHPLAKRAKDIAAGSVLIASIGAVIIGLIIFLPYLKALL